MQNHRQWAQHISKHGYAVLTVQYRVASAAKKAFPEALEDVRTATRFVRSHSAELNVDKDRIGILGTSAGAHLAALAALAPANLEDQSPASDMSASDYKLLVGVYGIYDLFAHWQADLQNNPSPQGNVTRNFVGADPFEDQKAYHDASPIRHVTYAKNKLPVLLAWGTADDAVNSSQSEAFLKVLQQARFDARAHRLVGATHFWFNQDPDMPGTDSAWFSPRLLAFLKTHL